MNIFQKEEYFHQIFSIIIGECQYISSCTAHEFHNSLNIFSCRHVKVEDNTLI